MHEDFPDDEDGAALARLAADGVDLSLPRLIEFTIDAPGADAAHRIAALVGGVGYRASVEYDEGEPFEEGEAEDAEFGPSWTVYVAVEMVPSHGELLRIQHQLATLARPHGGECDGWGTAVEAPGEAG
ncbi:MAG: ribonuclease E inhibitor RraB [Deltaproteobacteria bacterium]